MRPIPLALATAYGSAGMVFTEALEAIQAVGPESGVPALQVGFLVTAAGMIWYTGRLAGKWEAAQKALIEKVEHIQEIKRRLTVLEGTVKILDRRVESRPLPRANDGTDG